MCLVLDGYLGWFYVIDIKSSYEFGCVNMFVEEYFLVYMSIDLYLGYF